MLGHKTCLDTLKEIEITTLILERGKMIRDAQVCFIFVVFFFLAKT